MHVFETEWGWIALAATHAGLSRASLPRRTRTAALAAIGGSEADLAKPTHLLRAAEQQMRDYLAGNRARFDFPLDLRWATPFQRRVLLVVAALPRGHTASYGEIAARAGSPGAARAVGQAMARNPLPLIIPCHRVVAADGSLGGFGGGRALKRKLLAHERDGG
jgi:methylated-DNA-[protein]-cysteine S-methyltransferase